MVAVAQDIGGPPAIGHRQFPLRCVCGAVVAPCWVSTKLLLHGDSFVGKIQPSSMNSIPHWNQNSELQA